jgi:hypothetical protein
MSGFYDVPDDDGSAPPMDLPPMDDAPPMAPMMDIPSAPALGPSLGDILRKEGKTAASRKNQLKATPMKEDPGEKLQNELHAAIARRKEALQKVPKVEDRKKDQKEQKSELQNTILQGIASLRKVGNRRPSMDAPKGTRGEVAHIPGGTGKKWTPKPVVDRGPVDNDVAGMRMRCGYCKETITNFECIDTQNGVFHTDCFVCTGCTRQLLGEYLTVNGVFFHPECLNCYKCLISLIDQPMMCTPDKKLFCGKDAPRDYCGGCNGRLESGRVVQIQDKNWHEACFKCCECQDLLAGKVYMFHEGQFFCKPDYQSIFAVKCTRCRQEADGPCVNIQTPDGAQLTYHQKCYLCRKCNVHLRGKGAYQYEGDIYCKTHYDAQAIASYS